VAAPHCEGKEHSPVVDTTKGLHGKTFSPLSSPPVYDLPTVSGLHSNQKPVGLSPLALVWLICSLHGVFPYLKEVDTSMERDLVSSVISDDMKHIGGGASP